MPDPFRQSVTVNNKFKLNRNPDFSKLLHNYQNTWGHRNIISHFLVQNNILIAFGIALIGLMSKFCFYSQIVYFQFNFVEMFLQTRASLILEILSYDSMEHQGNLLLPGLSYRRCVSPPCAWWTSSFLVVLVFHYSSFIILAFLHSSIWWGFWKRDL